MKKIVCFLSLFFCLALQAQYGAKDSNKIGISGGVTQMGLFSSQFNAKPELGWTGGFSVRGNYYNDWQMAFGMYFTESNFSLQATTNEDIKYTMQAAQVYLTGSYMIIENHLTFELGPVLQVNGKLAIKKEDELKFLADNPNLVAKDLLEVTKISGNLYAGVTAGLKNVRLHVAYQYGVNNFFNNLNKNEELSIRNGENFKANYGILSGMITFYL